MDWYKKLPKRVKVQIRSIFEMACGFPLNAALHLFTFSECMELLYNKLSMEGFDVYLDANSGCVESCEAF